MSQQYFIFLSFLLLSYLVGAIPFSLIFAKLLKGIDLRDFGSGNAGGTNAARVLGKKIGILVMICDVGKSILICTLLTDLFYQDYLIHLKIFETTKSQLFYQFLGGLIGLIGHIFPVWAQFKGGKGVANMIGMLLVLFPYAFIFTLLISVSVIFVTKMVSVGSILASFLFAPILYFSTEWGLEKIPSEDLHSIWILVLSLPLIIFSSHHQNIKRLIQGKENKIL
jgi:glycerol-3-phosphate acyltransferase PlsY